ncbi:MAG TPA: pantoate--beta-alanine ligase [Egibacteraceae bacterium]|nr:pantoate--beta-alanine ligase [Egibacteraceae bacterium]
MRAVRTVGALRAALAPQRRAGARVGLVPTMGALHDGHVRLVSRMVGECDVAVVSIFVNPLQFAPGEDFATYPRDLDADVALLDRLGVDVVFCPEADFAPALVTVRVGALGGVLDGVSRPGHFDGVATIVTKLLNAVQPQRAYFGEKDYQQLVVLRAVATDLAVPVEIVTCPTVRDADGLALSSRNAYLSPSQRAAAVALPESLRHVAGSWAGDADAARDALRRRLERAPGVRLDYAEVCDPETLEPLEGVVEGPAQALVAAYVGTTRLIDNIRLEPRPVERHRSSAED